jgi:nicotinamide mononucleotide transporter
MMSRMSWSEILGFVAGVACVWLYVRQSVWAWPTGIANSAFWLILFASERLFLDSALQVVYIVLGIIGWVFWSRPLLTTLRG